ncbi:MAG: hypothetical protein AB7S26_09890 [Sandaracinaceae bacterium]
MLTDENGTTELEALRAEVRDLRETLTDVIAFVMPRTNSEYQWGTAPRDPYATQENRRARDLGNPPKAWPLDLGRGDGTTFGGYPLTAYELERLERARALFLREGAAIRAAVDAELAQREADRAAIEAERRALRGDATALEAIDAFCAELASGGEAMERLEGEMLVATDAEVVLVAVEHERRRGSGDALMSINEARRRAYFDEKRSAPTWTPPVRGARQRDGESPRCLVACLTLADARELLGRDLPTPPSGRVLVVLERAGAEPVLVDGTLERRS